MSYICVYLCVLYIAIIGAKSYIFFYGEQWASGDPTKVYHSNVSDVFVTSLISHLLIHPVWIPQSFLSSCSCMLYSSHFLWWCNHHPLELYTHWGAGAHTSFCDCLHGHTCQHSTGCSQWKPDWPLSDVPWHSHLHSRVPIHLPSHCLQSVWQ